VADDAQRPSPEVGHDADLGDGEALGDERLLPGVGDDERRAPVGDVLAEGARQRGLAPLGPRRGQAGAAHEELAVLVDERDERDGRVEQPRRESRDAVEGRVGRGVE